MGRAARRTEKIGRYAKLKRWLHGMRKVASGWEDDYARRLVEDGFQVRVVVHGDDFTYAGTESEFKKVQTKKANGTTSR